MEQSSSECPIEKLPPEIMHSIFEFLDLESLKSASLTCQRWERIFVNYCTSRLTLCINAEDGKNLDSTEPPTKRLQRATKMLQRTQRVYRNVHLSMMYGRFGPKHINGVLGTIFAPHRLQQLVVLDLNLTLYSEHMVKDVSDAIAKMNRLQELRAIIFCKQLFSIGRDGCNSYYKLTNPSLHKLAIRGLLPTVIDCPNMRSLELPLCLFEKSIANQIYFRHNEREERYWRVEQVEKLVIMHLIAMDSMDPIEFLRQFLQQMPRLKTLHLDTIRVPEKKLQLICETCTQLEELVLTSLEVDDPHMLRHISKLTHLRNIGVRHLLGNDTCPLSFASVNLPSLEKIFIISKSIDYQSLACIPSIKWCKISPSLGLSRSLVCDGFAEHWRQLRFLWLNFVYVQDFVSIFLAELPKMPALEMLVLEDVFKLPDLHTFLPPLPQLKRLVIYHTKYILQQYNNTAELAKLVPNVKRIEMIENKYRHEEDFVGNF
ncbi:uncharacterized protein LOC120904236 [Anopheles arabiensis]|uniref:uncharacterized protein LOC120904236 n=1 Tax=Anopheles arabiensis TaxID=7173 RepID=UPI001AACA521|nr:uncharacterized protein LOC120904236 [Anopheles arabiensis]XP_061510341.1 uncharacterized protein LOC4577595 [Anopheles gambiae]